MKQGDRVRILKGAKVHGTFPEGQKIQGRSCVVTVRWVDDIIREKRRFPEPNSGINFHDGYEVVGKEVCWAGTAGYWHYANVNDTEMVEEL